MENKLNKCVDEIIDRHRFVSKNHFDHEGNLIEDELITSIELLSEELKESLHKLIEDDYIGEIEKNLLRCDMTGGAKCESDSNGEPIVKEVLAINVEDWKELKSRLLGDKTKEVENG